jgi:hypothetical protein
VEMRPSPPLQRAAPSPVFELLEERISRPLGFMLGDKDAGERRRSSIGVLLGLSSCQIRTGVVIGRVPRMNLCYWPDTTPWVFHSKSGTRDQRGFNFTYPSSFSGQGLGRNPRRASECGTGRGVRLDCSHPCSWRGP